MTPYPVYELELKTPTEGAPVLQSCGVSESKALHHSETSQPIFILQEPVQFLHTCDVVSQHAGGKHCNGKRAHSGSCVFQLQEMKSYGESLCTFCRSYKQSHVSLSSIQTDVSSQIWCPFKIQSVSKQRSN